MKRRVLSVLLAILMVLSLMPTIFAPKTAVAEVGPIDQKIVQGGNILHCFDWSYNEIRANLQAIKAAGYVAVQTSPVQPAKDYNGSWTDTGGNWWKLYQPIGIRIAGENESWLGTAEDLTELCTAAEQEGIYVIVDIVANHLGNKGDGGYTVNGNNNLSDQVDDDLKNADYFHPEENEIDYNTPSDRFNTTHYHMNMPDLNTGNEVIQQKVLDLLKACIDCGVDGFRFDAAKHIEVPADPEGTRSDFWPTVIDGARTYASDKGAYLFIYGEALDDLGTDEVNYTQYIGLTDNVTGNNTRTAVKDQNAGGVNATSIYYRSGNPSSYVIWAESHDNYLNDHTDGIPTEKMIQTWAIVGARANSTALFFARPNERIGLASTDTSWKSPAVAAVNKFKNHYKGKGEYFSYDSASNKTVWIERGTSGGDAGVSIVKLDGAGAVSLTVQKMSNGLYVDEITGNVFVVKDGTITGNVGPTGVAVVYKAAPYITTSPIYLVPGVWSVDNPKFVMYVFNSVDDNVEPTWTVMTHSDGDGTYEANLPAGNWNGLNFIRMSSSNTSFDWTSVWNWTADLAPDPGCDTFTITGWGGKDNPDPGTWSASVSTENPNAGYYLVGTMTGWSVLPEYKMTQTDAGTEEYTIDVPLLRTSKPFHSQFKVVYSPNGVTYQTWYPGGEKNNYGDYDGEIPQSGVYSVYFRPGYDGESGWHDSCIYAERSKYFVTVNDADKNGTVTVDKSIAAAGETVTVTVTPNEGYELDTLVYMCETGFNTGEFTTTEITGTTFAMPAENAAVKATFKEATVAEPEFKTHALALEGKIGLIFFMDLSGLTDGEKAESYMTFAITGSSPVDDAPVVFDANNTNQDGSYYGFTCYVTSIQMADTITATFHCGDRQPIEQQYSIKQYIETFEGMQSQFDDETVNLVHALADYGHYVQAFLATQRSWKLGIDYAEMDKYYTSNYDYDRIVNELNNLKMQKDLGDENIAKVTYSVIFDSDTAIRVYFTPAAGFNGDVSAWMPGYQDEAYLKRGTDGRYTVEIANIPAHLLGETYNIFVFTGENCFSSTVAAYTRVEVSAMSYVRSILNSAAYNDAAKKGVASLYAYWQAAQAYKDAH